MGKKIGTLVFLCLMWTVIGFAAESGRWQWVDSTAHYTYYLDTETIGYDAAFQHATYWQKVIGLGAPEGTYNLYHIEINFVNKTGRSNEYATVKNGQVVRQHTINNTYYYIHPNSVKEKEANILASKFGLDSIYPQGEARWQWVKSTDKMSLYVLRDAVTGDGEYCYIWAKWQPIDGNPWTTRYACSLTSREMGYKSSPTYKVRMKQILPDTMEEAIYNAALRTYQGR